MSEYLFTSESVSEGHPDKVADRVSDAIVDLYFSKDPQSRVAVETLVTTNRIVLAGEVRCAHDVTHDEIENAARAAVKSIGYEQDGFHWETAVLHNYIHAQSADIAMGVDNSADKQGEEGAGDQGIMFGYACNETEHLMPAPIAYSHEILEKLAAVRHGGDRRLEPDSKSQVTLKYKDGYPVGATSVVVSTQHAEGVTQAELKALVKDIVTEVLPEGWMPSDDELYVNPTGQFIIGGPDGDTGLTGRKIIVDTYGGAAPHGGGAFSGKDPTKVDRSAAYAARYLAKNVVAAGIADNCTIQLSYAIGVAKPLSVYVDLWGKVKVDSAKVSKALQELMDLSPTGIRTHLGLNKPIYERTAAYGHFGRLPDADGGFSWEKTDLTTALKAKLSL
ncbi:methionine adenosyltransferase [Temperatibacter marinus]|uniref:S-adenosylmethionine synthase n=1 Tax=Temperatibacter marinus TaxID=1456591 RepID=A0AA52EKJ1_9PROT|nr:methionine adenosyltransferase [Temperatibacter marinus]WND03929.1 methionine adenosyltransferase [Temperatibacter marinus]